MVVNIYLDVKCMKRIIVFLAVMFLFVGRVQAYDAVTVMDADSGRVLYSKNGDKKYLIASTTKIMTTLVALNYADLDEVVTAGDEVLDAYGSSIYLKPQEKMTMRGLLYGLMLRSGNDAGLTIAVNTAGSVEGFVRLMNEMALMIGMHDSSFSNPHGLDDETENESTTNDMCLLMREAMENEEFRKITSTKKYEVKTNFGEYEWYNKNRLITDYKYATGGKIGYTTRARHTFVSSATKDGKNLVIATFVDPDRFDTHEKLYEKYFAMYDSYTLLDKDNPMVDYKSGYKVYTASSFKMLLTKEEKKRVKREVELYEGVEVGDGDTVIGNMTISLDDEVYVKTNIYAKKIEKPKSWWEKLKEFLGW